MVYLSLLLLPGSISMPGPTSGRDVCPSYLTCGYLMGDPDTWSFHGYHPILRTRGTVPAQLITPYRGSRARKGSQVHCWETIVRQAVLCQTVLRLPSPP